MDLVKDKVYKVNEFYEWALSVSDYRVENWFLMQAYTPTIVLTIIYLLTVWQGPKLMKKREPFQLKTPLILYNVIIIVINCYIFSELLSASWNLNYGYICQPVSYTEDPNEMRVAKALWWFFFSKLAELLDTIFFVLRKKNSQMTFLHVFHHASMFPLCWIGVKWVAGGQPYFVAMINSLVHVVMYTYYGLSALGPGIQKYLWWKKYITILQIVQFMIALIHTALSLWIHCDFPAMMRWAGIFYGIIILLLFFDFYFQSYVKVKRQKTKSGKKENGKLFNEHVTTDTIAANGHMDSKKEK